MDFIRVCTKESRKKGGPIEVYADFVVGRSKDLLVQGGAFYAVWDEEAGLWSREAYDVQRLVDLEIRKKAEELQAQGLEVSPKYMSSFDTNRWIQFVRFTKNVPDNSHPLDTKITFADKVTKKTDYASRRLSYSVAPGDISAYDELVSVLYTPEERFKFEWAAGSIIAGESKKIEKFLVFFGGPGTGKSTILKIIAKLFGDKVKDGGYVAYFDAQALTGNSNAFSTAAFKDNPLVAIQHDGDLSKIETNARLNAIVSHEDMEINEKFRAQYTNRINAFLFMGTNKPVQITDSKSGLIRRLIDVNPTGYTHDFERYNILMDRIDFELGAIAHHCLQVYKEAGKNAFGDYSPENMMLKTDMFYNFVEDHHDIFKTQEATTLSQAWELYKEYCDKSEFKYRLSRVKFREDLKDYFETFETRGLVDGIQSRSVYRGFTGTKFKETVKTESKENVFSLVMNERESILDEMYAGAPAQYSNADGNPKLYWDFDARLDKNGKEFVPKESQVVSTVLGDLDTSKLHFLKVPQHHIVIDFDLKDEDGNKSLELNRQAASSFPPTYAEISKSGQGVHLHYIYDGDTAELSNVFADGIEVKTFHGKASLRRKLTWCNNVAVATINGGLNLRKKPTMQTSTLKTEQGLRAAIIKNLKKEVHPGTKPSIDFIEFLLKQAKNSGIVYDVSDMLGDIAVFATKSTNQAPACIKAVARMKPNLKSDVTAEDVVENRSAGNPGNPGKDDRIVFFDCEVYPNLFVVCWKYKGSDTVVPMLNPTPAEIEQFLHSFKLVGYNNRSYDNHILWARQLGADNEQLYRLSQRIIVEKDDSARFGSAWAASYADVLDFAHIKETLKWWEIELGIHHMEMDIPWDQPVPDNKIQKVIDYCCNDVRALEEVFNACKADFRARQILADLSGLSVNHSTRQHVMRILFGSEKNPQKKFVYTDLSEMFPGYKFDKYAKTDKSTYRGEVVGEGGYVYAEPGMYEDVAVLDIASMHPTSIIELNLFGPYTEKFQRLLDARLALKHGDRAMFEKNLPGVDWPETDEEAGALSDALKLVANSTYGYTCAKFDNPARDPRNIDNIVAKRGALFMVDLKTFVQDLGYTVAHIKTDSIKIPNANKEIIKLVQEFGEKYGYTFEHEDTYKRMCLVNDAVLVAYVAKKEKNGKVIPEHWKAVGAQFQHPFVFKYLFTDEPITFKDLCERKQVKKGAMYLKYDGVEKEIGKPKDEILEANDIDISNPESPDYGDRHIGRSGLFVPINPDQEMIQGAELVCRRDDLGKDYAVPGTKGFLWAEAEMVRVLQNGAIERLTFERLEDAVEGTGSIADVIDMRYYTSLAEEAAQAIEEFGDFEGFIS